MATLRALGLYGENKWLRRCDVGYWYRGGGTGFFPGRTKAKHARDYHLVNHLGTKNLLEACARFNPGIEKFILVSSQSEAGPSPDGRPVDEGNTARPLSDYARSKLLAEEEARRYKDRLPVVILRHAIVCGPRDVDVFELFRWASRGLTLEMTGGNRYINLCFVIDRNHIKFHKIS